MSYLEIYNQTGFDLLDPNREIKSMEDLPQVGSEHGYASSKPNRKMAGLCFVHGFQYRGRWFMLCAWFLILVGLVLNFGVLALAAVCCRNVCVWGGCRCVCVCGILYLVTAATRLLLNLAHIFSFLCGNNKAHLLC